MGEDRGPESSPLDHAHPGTNGHHRPVATGGSFEPADPVDLVAVQADDELISALAAGMAVSAPGFEGYDTDDHIAAILAAWKAEVDADPIPELVDLDAAVRTIVAARPSSRRFRHLAPVAAAAAFLVLAIGGVSVGSYSAGPDDGPLWDVSKALYQERAGSMEAKARVEQSLDRAKQAFVAGDVHGAEQELQRARADLATVRPQEGSPQLAEVQDFLVAKALETPNGTPTDPGTPLATNKTRKVPVGAAVTTSPAANKPGPAPASPRVTPGPPPPSPVDKTAPPVERPELRLPVPRPTQIPPPVITAPVRPTISPPSPKPTPVRPKAPASGQSMAPSGTVDDASLTATTTS